MLSAQLPWQQRKASGRSAMPQPTQNHGKCVPGAAAGVIRSIAMSLVQLTQCRNAVSSAQAPLGTRQHLFFPVCEQARCAKGDAVSPSPIVTKDYDHEAQSRHRSQLYADYSWGPTREGSIFLVVNSV